MKRRLGVGPIIGPTIGAVIGAVIALVIASSVPLASIAAIARPDGLTGECKDGSTTTASSRHDACADHGGVSRWYGPATATSSVSPAPTAKPITAHTRPAGTPKRIGAAAGAKPGDVWVNPATKVYHCAADPRYGQTAAGEYMSEAAAKAAGNRASHGKACS